MRVHKIIPQQFLISAASICSEILESSERALAYLTNIDARKRRVAIYICDNYYKIESEAFLMQCKELACVDDDDYVRVAALHTLARRFSGTRDKEISQFLAKLAISSRTAICFQAYVSLTEVHFGFTETVEQQYRLATLGRIKPFKIGISAEEMHELCERLVPNEKDLIVIDWEFVHQFIPRTKPSPQERS